MILKDCGNVSFLERSHTDMPAHTDSHDLNMKLSTDTIDIPIFQECVFSVCSKKHNSDDNSSLNSALLHQQSHRHNKKKSDINMKFIEKFSELNIDNSDDVKPSVKEVEAIVVDSAENCIDQKVLMSDSRNSLKDSHEQLPVAKIFIKKNDREPVCISCNNEITCCKKSELNQKDNVNKQSLNPPLTELLISRSPDKKGRTHCKVDLSTNPLKGHNKVATKQQKNATCLTDANFFSFHGNSPSDFSAHLLHGCGGTFHETVSHSIRNDMNSFCRIDQEFFLEQLGSCSVGSYANSVYSPFSNGYSSPSSISNVESCSGDTGIASPSTPELYPTPPNSAFENTLSSFANDVSSQTSVSDCLSDLSISQINVNDDSLLSFSSLEGSLTSTDASSPLSEKTNELDMLSPNSSLQDEEINKIIWYLKNGAVNPITAKIITDCSESFDKEYNSPSANDQDTQKLNSLQKPIYNNQHTEQSPVAAQLPVSVTPSYSSICNSENNLAQSTIILMPIQLQTVAVPGPKDGRRQRELRPNICSNLENGVGLAKSEERSPMINETTKTNSVYPGGNKSVKAAICSSISREEKNRLLKSATLEEQPTAGETKLHLAALKGDEKLMYVLVESKRTNIKSENLNARIDNLNPRISVKEKIQSFVNVQNSDGCTPLYYAVLTGNNLLTAYLLECGADPFIKDYKNGNTPFHVATVRGDSAVLIVDLFSFRRNIGDVRNNKGQSILMAAVINHQRKYKEVERTGIKLIKHLLKKNHQLSSQDCEGKTALHKAVQKKDMELLEILLTCATDRERAKLKQDNEGNTILHEAASLTDIDVKSLSRLIWIIIQHCPELTEIKNKKGELPYEVINENRKQERELLKIKMDEYGFRN